MWGFWLLSCWVTELLGYCLNNDPSMNLIINASMNTSSTSDSEYFCHSSGPLVKVSFAAASESDRISF